MVRIVQLTERFTVNEEVVGGSPTTYPSQELLYSSIFVDIRPKERDGVKPKTLKLCNASY